MVSLSGRGGGGRTARADVPAVRQDRSRGRIEGHFATAMFRHGEGRDRLERNTIQHLAGGTQQSVFLPGVFVGIGLTAVGQGVAVRHQGAVRQDVTVERRERSRDEPAQGEDREYGY